MTPNICPTQIKMRKVKLDSLTAPANPSKKNCS